MGCPQPSAAPALPPAALAHRPPSKSAFLEELTEVDFNSPPFASEFTFLSFVRFPFLKLQSPCEGKKKIHNDRFSLVSSEYSRILYPLFNLTCLEGSVLWLH